MTTSGKAHGKNLVFKLDTQAGSLTDISGWVESVDGLPPEVEMDKYACGGAAGYSGIPGLQTASIKLECIFDDTANSAWSIVKDYLTDTDTRSFEFGPAGSTSGYAKLSGELRIKKVSLPVKTTAGLRFTIDADLDGACAIGEYN